MPIRLRRADLHRRTMRAVLATAAYAPAALLAQPQAAVPAAAAASEAAEASLPLAPSRELAPPPRGDAARSRSLVIRADRLQSRPDLDTVAEGHVEFRRAGTVIRADRVTYDSADDLAKATGNVRVSRDGNHYWGPELQLYVQRFQGFFLEPHFTLGRTGAGGTAERFDFLDPSRSVAVKATYTSCPRDGSGDPDWLLKADRVRIDLEANEGVAEGAVLRFLGVPILAMPVMSFPLTDDRKSGWLPPTVNLDSKSGLELAVPYYWNIAPNRDATITPGILTRRGAALATEFRYLEPGDEGRIEVEGLPNDRVARHDRWLSDFAHHGARERIGLNYKIDAIRVSDDDYWKDFQRQIRSFTPRLLPLTANIEQGTERGGFDSRWYAGTQRWQVLSSGDPTTEIVPPYDRSGQLGAHVDGALPLGMRIDAVSEINRFTLAEGLPSAARPNGWRWHGLASLTRPWETPATWVRPKFMLNAASYDLDQAMVDGRTRASRLIPTFSLDTGAVFERDSTWFGKAQRQTLEPRLFYANTPFHEQRTLPNFDSAPIDFNTVSVFTENAFSGIDRVSDGHQITAGATTRWLGAGNGAETLRLGIAQRYLFRDLRITPDGVPQTQRLSDLLLDGSTSLVPSWQFDVSLQYSAETSRPERSIVSVRYLPEPFHALSATYRFARGLSEQVELGWQWPVYRRDPGAAAGNGKCGGSLYAVGRLNYSTRDSRLTDSIVGFEYDAGCWIGRVVAERLSVGRTEASTRLLLQLELVGLSRIGANPLQVLKDNIPGYRLLREERKGPYEPTIDD
ncbi:MAG TPA: LPS assembly protein LptD [Burkholderiaceae bacterium]|nr:LPS assembly protein LptD [Burkholderiaceae bacterium]